jgi:hypothetical protein
MMFKKKLCNKRHRYSLEYIPGEKWFWFMFIGYLNLKFSTGGTRVFRLQDVNLFLQMLNTKELQRKSMIVFFF